MKLSFLRKDTKGFSLVELLVVLGIMGVLASIVLGSLTSARERSRDAKRISDIKQIELAVEQYFNQNNTYPTNINSTSLGIFLRDIPTDPSTNNPYNYISDGNSFCLGARLEQQNANAINTATCDDGVAGGSYPYKVKGP